MRQIFLVLKREYLTRVKKKSFLLATILTPLVMPAIIIAIVYFAGQEKESRSDKVLVLDESGYFSDAFDVTSFEFEYITGDLESAKKQLLDAGAFGLMYLPKVDLSDASVINYNGFELYSKTNPSVQAMQRLEANIRNTLEDIKLQNSGLDPAVISNLRVRVDLDSFNISESGESQESNAQLSFAVGYGTGFLIYMFIFIYGAQIMQSVLDEKTSRIVEVIISSVRPSLKYSCSGSELIFSKGRTTIDFSIGSAGSAITLSSLLSSFSGSVCFISLGVIWYAQASIPARGSPIASIIIVKVSIQSGRNKPS